MKAEDAPRSSPYRAVNLDERALLREIVNLADPTGIVGELALLEAGGGGSTEALGRALDELERAGYVTREASDRVRITPAGIAAAQPA
jgi:hypothetical protein